MRSRREIIDDARDATGFSLPTDGPIGLELLTLEVLCDIRDTLAEISAGQDDIIKELQARPVQPQLPPAPVTDEPKQINTTAVASKTVGEASKIGFKTPKL